MAAKAVVLAGFILLTAQAVIRDHQAHRHHSRSHGGGAGSRHSMPPQVEAAVDMEDRADA